MPPKRKRKAVIKRQKVQQKKCIEKPLAEVESKLLEISLKVEEYVYNNVPITPLHAASYIARIAGYKHQCLGDKRCLQVIEKLERCMRGIIEEQKEVYDNSKETNPEKNYTNLENKNKNETINTPTSLPIATENQKENCLSWVETLRYVREINEDEKVPSIVSDSFWENLAFPGDWNEQQYFQ